MPQLASVLISMTLDLSAYCPLHGGNCSQRTRCHLPAPAAWCRLLVHQYQAWPSVRIRHAARAKPVTQGRIKVP